MTRDLTTEGPVPGQERIDVRTEPCSKWCPFQPCDTCPYKGGTWGAADEQPEPKPTREEDSCRG